MIRRSPIFVLCCAACLLVTYLQAPAASTNAPVRRISKLYSELGANKARDRKAAQAKLTGLASNYWEAVKVQGLRTLTEIDDPEVTIRTKEVLRTGVDGMVFSLERGFIGVALLEDNLAGPSPALTIASVIPGTAAEREGIAVGAKILGIDDKQIKLGFGIGQFTSYVGKKGPGAIVALKLDDHGVKKIMSIKLGERPATGPGPSLEQQKATFFKDWLEVNLEELRRR